MGVALEARRGVCFFACIKTVGYASIPIETGSLWRRKPEGPQDISQRTPRYSVAH